MWNWTEIRHYDKIYKEAPYHALTNAGHISYVELDGDTAKNVEAFESVIRCMHDAGIGYGSVNHPVDRDPACGYVGVIDDVCPRCGRREGEPISEEKLEELRKLGYGSVNHPVDRDPACGYVGVIDDVCPRCGRREGEPISEEKLEELRKLYPNMPQFYGCE